MQGGGVEDSVSWDQDKPPSTDDGIQMVNALRNRLQAREQNTRAESINKAIAYIERCRGRGVDAPVSWTSPVRGDRDNRRTDIEVITGRAFE